MKSRSRQFERTTGTGQRCMDVTQQNIALTILTIDEIDIWWLRLICAPATVVDGGITHLDIWSSISDESGGRSGAVEDLGGHALRGVTLVYRRFGRWSRRTGGRRGLRRVRGRHAGKRAGWRHLCLTEIHHRKDEQHQRSDDNCNGDAGTPRAPVANVGHSRMVNRAFGD